MLQLSVVVNILLPNESEVHFNISKSVKSEVIEMYRLSWKESVFDSQKCLNYRFFKQDLKLENYFNILPEDLAKSFCQFRSLNIKMPIELGKYVWTPRDGRICELYFLDKIGDAYHYLLECTYISDSTEGFICQGICLLDQILILSGELCVQMIPRIYSK